MIDENASCTCRFHGRDCLFSELGNVDTFVVGYLSGIGDNPSYVVKMIHFFRLTFCKKQNCNKISEV